MDCYGGYESLVHDKRTRFDRGAREKTPEGRGFFDRSEAFDYLASSLGVFRSFFMTNINCFSLVLNSVGFSPSGSA